MSTKLKPLVNLPTRLYHGTRGDHVGQIIRHGLMPRGDTRINMYPEDRPTGSPFVCLTLPNALLWARHAARGEDSWAIVEVDRTSLDELNLHPDEGFVLDPETEEPDIENLVARVLSKRLDWRQSLNETGDVAYLGQVGRKDITRVAEYKPQGNDLLIRLLMEIEGARDSGKLDWKEVQKRWVALTKKVLGYNISVTSIVPTPAFFRENRLEIVDADRQFRELAITRTEVREGGLGVV